MDLAERKHAKKHGELEIRSAMQVAFPQARREARDAAIRQLRAANRARGGA